MSRRPGVTAVFAMSPLLIVALAEGLVAVAKPPNLPVETQQNSADPITVLVAADLNNEKHIILNVLSAILDSSSPDDVYELIFAYAREKILPVESELVALARRDTRLILLPTRGRAGKCAQVNNALFRVRTRHFLLCDADSIPTVRSLDYIHFDHSTVIQGWNSIRNARNLCEKIVQIEFATEYLVSYYARSILAGVAYYCGSNAIWPTSVARSIGFDDGVLLEDVDASLRAAFVKTRIRLEPALKAEELAPVRVSDWWNQRKRWAAGYIELMIRHRRDRRWETFSTWRRMNWWFAIVGRESVYAALLLLGPVELLKHLAKGDCRRLVSAMSLVLSSLWTLGALEVIPTIIQLRRIDRDHRSLGQFSLYWVLYPLFRLAKAATHPVGIFELARGTAAWNPTPRS